MTQTPQHYVKSTEAWVVKDGMTIVGVIDAGTPIFKRSGTALEESLYRLLDSHFIQFTGFEKGIGERLYNSLDMLDTVPCTYSTESGDVGTITLVKTNIF